jgi:hypothetical protein
MSNAGFSEGAVAFLDALGFKGIWKRKGVTPEALLGKLQAIADEVPDWLTSELRTRLAEMDTLPASVARFAASATFAFLSDTVVIGVPRTAGDCLVELIGQSDDARRLSAENFTILSAAILAQHVVRRMSQEPVPLAMRGCISYGEFAMTDRFVLGEAVDDAAEGEKVANAAIVWLHPSAAARWELDEHGNGRTQERIFRYPVPVKGKGTVDVPCVVPFGAESWEADPYRQRVLDTFDRASPDVLAKRRETERFLDAARTFSTPARLRAFRELFQGSS